MTSQLNFDLEIPRPDTRPGALFLGPDVRATLAATIKAAGKPRAEIASAMSTLTGAEITRHMINAWTAESREAWRFPLEYAAAFEAACDSYALTELIAAKRGARLLVGEEVLSAELGRLEALEAEIKAQKRALKKRIGGRG